MAAVCAALVFCDGKAVIKIFSLSLHSFLARASTAQFDMLTHTATPAMKL